MRVTFYADFVCPFSYCAERALLPRLAEQFDLTVTWRPYELNPGTPAGGRVLNPRDGGRIWGGYRRLTADWDLPIARRAPSAVPNTQAILAAALAAESAGQLEAFRERAYAAYWVDGANLGEPAVVQELAGAVDLSDPRWKQELHSERTSAQNGNVTAVPAFVVNGAVLIGLHEEERLERFLEGQS
ncbi:MAG: putative DsbA family dithiol-disulfide isomerase [Myxococcota bacterium]|jgi:predicted DsbA family dithiol-disulfide isomerase